jgi:exo-poly-alpha-galacturonosidase
VPDQPHQDLHFDRVRFINARPTSIRYLRDSTFNDVVFDNTADPWVIKDSGGLRFTGTTTVSAVSADAAAGPRWPAGAELDATAGAGSVTLHWPAAADNAGVAGYQVFVDDALVATPGGDALGYVVDSLAPARAYRLRVAAVDATGSATAGGPGVDVTTTGSPDIVPPVAGATVSVRPGSVGTTWLRLDWAAATDEHGVRSYRISANGTPVAAVAGGLLTAVITGLRPGTGYAFAVTAVDTSGNATGYQATALATTNPSYDTGVPRWPRHSAIRVVGLGPTSVTLSWPAARDDQHVIGYRLYVDGRPVQTGEPFTPVNGAGTVTGRTFTVTGLPAHTRHTFTVEAGDSAFKWTGSGPSLTVALPAPAR